MHPAGNSGSVRFFFLASGPCLVIEQTDNYKHTQVQLFILDWTVTRLEWLCQLCYVNYLCVEKHQKFRTRNYLGRESRGLFRALGYNELIIYR